MARTAVAMLVTVSVAQTLNLMQSKASKEAPLKDHLTNHQVG